MDNKLFTKLFELCRCELQRTWQDPDEDRRLQTHIKNGVLYIQGRCGVTDEDFLAGGKANALFLAYIRRAISGDLSTFEADYLSDIVSLQIDCEVESYGEN